MAHLGRRQPFPWRFRKALGITYAAPPAPVGRVFRAHVPQSDVTRPVAWRFRKALGITYATVTPPVYTGNVNVEFYYAGAWVDITADVHAETGHRMKRGIEGNGPLDGVAGPGEYVCALQNWAKGARPQGYYSPLHANCRAGWTWGVPLRVIGLDPSTGFQYVLHRGKVRVIEPTAGKYKQRLVHVVSYDGMHDLLEADVRDVSVREGLSAAELITAILDSLPSDQQPVARSFGVGADMFAYAFHDLGEGEKALSLINDIAVDEHAFVAMKGDGTLLFRNRHERAEGTSAGTFADTMHGFEAPSSLDQAYNEVRVTIQPPVIDAAATSVLYADRAEVRSIPSGRTDEFWVAYSDPADATRTLIGGLAPFTLAFTANSQADGLGGDLTADIVVLFEPFATSAKLTVTNTSAFTAYFVDVSGEPALTITARGVYARDAQTFQAFSTQAYSTRQLSISLRYQDDPEIAQSYANYIVAQRKTLTNQPQSVEFLANTAALVTHALSRDVGDVITVSETMTGISTTAVIQSVQMEIRPGFIVWCRWGLSPTSPFTSWKLGVVGRSELTTTTQLGF